MTPAQAQQHALTSLETIGGKPVVLQESAKLSNHATIRIASASQLAHVLTYHPSVAHELAYLVCFQCGIAERAIRSAPDERFNVASTSDTYSRVQKLVADKNVIPANMVVSYSQMIADGLGTQLRSMPIGIRVDRILYEKHPELRDLQRSIAERQLREAAGCLNPSVKEMAPELLYNASVGMNASVALQWSQLWSDDTHLVPYRLSGHVGLGEKLLNSLELIPDEATHDRELVKAWAKLLGVDHLYEIGPVGL